MTAGTVVTAVPGKPHLLLGAFDIASIGYIAQEFFISGTASSYAPAGALGPDGQWAVTASARADYTTRVVVLTPADRAEFNGTVLVEWLNVSGGIDAPAVWFMAHREMIRAGYAYVAVSAQRVGVEGGRSLTGADMSLKAQNPTRYAPLHHPGDAFCYDIFSQIGQLARCGQPDGVMSALNPEHVVAVGESQSAMFLTTYINAVDPLAKVYDGFVVHSRFASAAPVSGESIFDESQPGTPQVVKFRPDLRGPVLTVITETDLLDGRGGGYYQARQPDSERLRIWEIPGTAHADNYTIQVAPIDTGFAPLRDIVAAYAPTRMLMGQQLEHCINFGPQHHYVLQAALARLHEWVRTGTPAPGAPRIELSKLSEGHPPAPVLDGNGLACGGIRTPWVDVPIARTSGVGGQEAMMSAIFGSGEQFDTATLRRLYPGGAAEYLQRFTVALDAAIESGFLLAADRGEIIQIAAATYPTDEGAQGRT